MEAGDAFWQHGKQKQVISPLTVAVERPDGTGVAVEGAQAFAIDGPPHRGDVVLGGAEEQVAVAVVADLGDGTLVAVQGDRFLVVSKEEEW